MRIYARTLVVRNFGSDDWMMLVALVSVLSHNLHSDLGSHMKIFTIGYLIAIWILRDNGMGFSGKTLSLEQMTNLVTTTLAIEVMYYIIISSIKGSILFFYLRIGKL
jgi:hypothetical protein